MSRKDLKFAILSVILIVASVSFIRTTLSTLSSNKRFDELKKHVTELEQKKAYIREELAFQQSSEFVEQEARNKLNMVKPNEQVYVLGEDLNQPKSVENVLSLSTSGTESEGADNNEVEKSNVRLWFELLF